MANQSHLGQAQDRLNLEPDLLAGEGGWVTNRPSSLTQCSEWDKAYQCFPLYIYSVFHIID